ncbi:MAG: hypothetical protein HY647_02345 [Acidobacteria bacterium]|nr:hypothetical protein [Acidobacteriota bacterium]
MKREDQVSYVMMFCALLLVKNAKATLEPALAMAPLSTRVRLLATGLTVVS